jgi:hypothetical protein
MSGVTVSISLTKAQQGELYMQHERRGRRIQALRVGLREIATMAEEAGAANILAKVQELLEVPKEPT